MAWITLKVLDTLGKMQIILLAKIFDQRTVSVSWREIFHKCQQRERSKEHWQHILVLVCGKMLSNFLFFFLISAFILMRSQAHRIIFIRKWNILVLIQFEFNDCLTKSDWLFFLEIKHAKCSFTSFLLFSYQLSISSYYFPPSLLSPPYFKNAAPKFCCQICLLQ